jgi:hypothetical protein
MTWVHVYTRSSLTSHTLSCGSREGLVIDSNKVWSGTVDFDFASLGTPRVQVGSV